MFTHQNINHSFCFVQRKPRSPHPTPLHSPTLFCKVSGIAAQACATKSSAGRNISLRKSFEDELLFLRRNSNPCIGDAEVQNTSSSSASLRTPYDNLATLGKLEGVADEINEDLAQAGWISRQRYGNTRLDVAPQLEIFLASAGSHRLHGGSNC